MSGQAEALVDRLKRLEPHRFAPAYNPFGSPSLKLLSRTEEFERDAQSELKQTLLEHYAERDPSSFFQVDAFTDVEAGDHVLEPDGESDDIMCSVTHELMLGTYAIRVLVTPGTSPEKTCTLLGKISEMIAERGFEFHANELERQIDAREARHHRSKAEVETP